MTKRIDGPFWDGMDYYDKMVCAVSLIALSPDMTADEMRELANEALDWHEMKIDPATRQLTERIQGD